MTKSGKYDPFQATPISRFASIAGEPTKASVRQETLRPYVEPYWYAPSAPAVHFHKLNSPGVIATATAFANPSAINSMSVEGNNALALNPQRLSPRVLFRKSVYAQAQTRFEVLQKWEGSVLELLPDSFTARLIDLTQSGPDEEAEFSFDEIDDGDKELLKPGAVFYWNIGYSDSPTGRARVSIIRFRRLPVWRLEELETAKRDAERLSDLLGWE